MKYLVVLPSYNERDNIVQLIEAIVKQSAEAFVCVVDDNSPDKTADLIRESLASWPGELKDRVHLIVRQTKDGRGGAVRDGILWGFKHPKHTFEAFVEMDCDFSHPPSDLPKGLQLLNQYQVVLGSRYPDGKIVGWPLKRKVLSFCSNLLARVLISWRIADYTNGFRFYTRTAAQLMAELPQRNKGYIYLSECLANFLLHGLAIGSFPIVFVNRQRGISNTTLAEITSALRGIFLIAWGYRFNARH